MPTPEARFPLGQTLSTPGALAALEEAQVRAIDLFARHEVGDWGEMPAEDAAENERSVNGGGRLVSAYTLTTGVKVWVITEGDRSATTILLPSEY